MVLVGYARVSSVGQSLEVQLEKLKHCDKRYQEQRSATGKRPHQRRAMRAYGCTALN
jgi:DNA invertase Pin-like site-specific DNA recombinase